MFAVTVPPSTHASAPAPAQETAPTVRLPRLEDFPEAGPNALATFQQRGIARIADELIVSVPILALALTLPQDSSWSPLAAPSSSWNVVVVTAAVFCVQLLYEIVAVAIWGQTLGKYALGIRVARYSDGGKPTLAQSCLRCLLWGAPGALALVLLSASAFGALPIFLTAWRDPLRRAVHDEAGGTIVVRTR
jgi:uncharacterized RDD family membrane protein YckC